MEIKKSNNNKYVNRKQKNTSAMNRHDPAHDGSWKMYRNDAANTGIQMLSGNIKTPEHERLIFVGGQINTSSFYADVNNDGKPEIFIIDSGKVLMIDMCGNTVWTSAIFPVNRIYDVVDLDGDGNLEVVVFSNERLIILDTKDGEILYIKEFDYELVETQIIIHDFDKDGRMELFVNVYGDSNIYIYKFFNETNRLSVELLNTIAGKEHMIESFRPAFAYTDINNDGYDEFIMVRYCGISIYNAKELSSGKIDYIVPVTKIDYTPTGADNGRFYGYFCMKDINGDGIPDGVMIADGVSMHAGVIANDTDQVLKKTWDKYYGYAGVTNSDGNNILMRVINDPVIQLKGDGDYYLVFGIFEYHDDAIRGRWTLNIINAKDYSHQGNHKLDGYYLWGVENVGDGNPLFFLTKENMAKPEEPGSYEIYTFDDQKQFIKLMDLEYSLIYKNVRMPGNISLANYNGNLRIYTIDLNNHGTNGLLVYKNNTFYTVNILSDGSCKILNSFTAEGEVIFADFKDENGNINFMTYNKKGVVKLLSSDGRVTWKRCCGGVINSDILIGDVSGKGKNSLVIEINRKVEIFDVISKGVSVLKNSFDGKDPVLADMNNDGIYEIIYKSKHNKSPMIKVIKADGSEIMSYIVSEDLSGEPMEFSGIREISIGDVTGDGVPDIIAGLQNSYTLGKTIIIDGASGELIYATPSKVKACFVHSNKMLIDRAALAQRGRYAIADIDNDGLDEVYFVSMETFMKIKSTDTGFKVDTYIAQINPENCRIYYSTPYICDINGDGTLDLFFGSGFNSISVYDGKIDMKEITEAADPKWKFILDNNRDILDRDQGISYLKTEKCHNTIIALQHSAGNEQTKGIIKAFCGVDGKVLWEYDMKEKFGGKNVSVKNIVSCDIDNDGKMEFILATNTGFIGAVRADQELDSSEERLIWVCDIGASISSIAVGDIDNDGFSEIIFNSDDGWINLIRNKS